ncbi:MAG: PsiF family protein [Sulfuritalea sp.]|nr:PsiF family protein [Sulfuritalea sp.]
MTPQQAKMGACASQGKGKKGDDYKKFMKDCLSK